VKQNSSVLKYDLPDHSVERDSLRHSYSEPAVTTARGPSDEGESEPSVDTAVHVDTNAVMHVTGLKSFNIGQQNNTSASLPAAADNQQLLQATHISLKSFSGIETRVIGRSHILSPHQINQIEAVSVLVILY
jgi:hypothetical protein